MSSLKTTVLSATAFVAMVQFCPAPFLAIPEAVAAGIGAVSSVVSTAADVTGNVASAVEGAKSSRVMRRQQLAQRASAVAGAEEGHKLVAARQEQNQLAWQLCHDQLTSASLNFSAPSPSNILVEGMPPACMTLSTVITGNYDTGNPVPQGSDSMLFQDLTSDQIQEIQDALDSAA